MALTETRLDKILGIGSGTGSRPAFGQPGARWIDTTGPSETVDTGSAWVSIGGGSAPSLAVATKTTTYTILSSDDVILADATGAGFTVSLPTAVGWTKRITIIKIDSSANAVTVGVTGGQTINGASTAVLNAQFNAITLVSDNANWHISESESPAVTASAALSADVTMTSANTFYDSASVSLGRGTWVVLSGTQYGNAYANYTAKLWDGTTVYDSGEHQSVTTGAPTHIALFGVVSPSTTTTYKTSVACDAAGQAIKAAATHNAAGNTASTIIAYKLA